MHYDFMLSHDFDFERKEKPTNLLKKNERKTH